MTGFSTACLCAVSGRALLRALPLPTEFSSHSPRTITRRSLSFVLALAALAVTKGLEFLHVLSTVEQEQTRNDVEVRNSTLHTRRGTTLGAPVHTALTIHPMLPPPLLVSRRSGSWWGGVPSSPSPRCTRTS